MMQLLHDDIMLSGTALHKTEPVYQGLSLHHTLTFKTNHNVNIKASINTRTNSLEKLATSALSPQGESTQIH